MALFRIYDTATITPNYNVRVFWDDVLNQIKVFYDPNDDGNYVETGDLGFTLDDFIVDYAYSFCDVNQLRNFFTYQNTYPYALLNQEQSAICQFLYCDLFVDLNASVVVNATDEFSSDGSITVSAVDNNPFQVNSVLKYSISDFTYQTGGQLSPTFSNLPIGNYTVWIRTEVNCLARANFVIGNNTLYGVRYRLEYKPHGGGVSRVDILKRGYSGSIEEVEGSGEPFILSYRGESNQDIFTPIVSSEAQIGLNSTYNHQFLELFTTDEREVQVVKYYNDVEEWRGYVLPMLFEEDYITKKNYPVTITASDQLADLKTYLFTNDSNQILTQSLSLIDVVRYCLRKTDINLTIRESINVFPSTLTVNADTSIFNTVFVDAKAYLENGEPKDCDYVLREVLKSFGARLFQANGRWNLEAIDQKKYISIPYREFNLLGTYLGNGTYSPYITLGKSELPNRATLAGAKLRILQNYGTIQVEQDLKVDNNLLSSGTFEAEEFGNTGFQNWSIDIGGAGASYGYELLTKPREAGNEGAFFVDFRNATAGAEVRLKALPFNLEFSQFAKVRVSFDVFTVPYFSNDWVYVDVSLVVRQGVIPTQTTRVYDSVTQKFKNTTQEKKDLADSLYNRYHIESHLNWQTLSFDFNFDSSQLNGSVELVIRLSGNTRADYANLTALNAVNINDGLGIRNHKNRARLYSTFNDLNGTEESVNRYKLDVTSWISDGGFSTRFSGDFFGNVIGNPFPLNFLQNVNIDNVAIEYLPGGNAPQEKFTFLNSINPKIRQALKVENIHGDLQLADKQYRRISKSYFRLADGTPTNFWNANYDSSFGFISTLLTNKFLGVQYAVNRWLLSGTLDLVGVRPSYSSMLFEQRTGNKYLPMAYTFNDKMNTVDVEIIEVEAGAGKVSDPNNSDPIYDLTDPNSGEFTREFTTEFVS